jgi:hypothetical protein
VSGVDSFESVPTHVSENFIFANCKSNTIATHLRFAL